MASSTKHALADALKQMMAIKPIAKITVKDLVEICNVNRQTFYYHFSFFYYLFTWCVRADTKKLSAFLELFSTWQ